MCLKLKFQDYKNVLEAARVKHKTNCSQKNKIHVDCLKNSLKNVTLKAQQRFKSESYNVFTEEINKIALKSNDDERMQSIDSIETYAYGTSNDLEEEIKCNNTIKWYKNV